MPKIRAWCISQSRYLYFPNNCVGNTQQCLNAFSDVLGVLTEVLPRVSHVFPMGLQQLGNSWVSEDRPNFIGWVVHNLFDPFFWDTTARCIESGASSKQSDRTIRGLMASLSLFASSQQTFRHDSLRPVERFILHWWLLHRSRWDF